MSGEVGEMHKRAGTLSARFGGAVAFAVDVEVSKGQEDEQA